MLLLFSLSVLCAKNLAKKDFFRKFPVLLLSAAQHFIPSIPFCPAFPW